MLYTLYIAMAMAMWLEGYKSSGHKAIQP